MIQSKHIFLFPFRWDVQKGNIFELSNTSMDDYETQLVHIGWSKEPYQNNLDFKDYNEFQYFYPFVRDALYDFEELNSNIIRHLEYNTTKEDKYIIHIDKEHTGSKEDRVLELNLIKLIVNIYTTGIGVLSFHLENTSYSSFQDILLINQFGRRIYPPFCKEEFNLNYVRSQIVAKKIELVLGNEKIEDSFEDFLDIKNQEDLFNNREQKLPSFIINLLLEKNQDLISIQPILDDRMFVISWCEQNEKTTKELVKFDDINKLKKALYGYQLSDEWYKYLYLDTKESSVYDIQLKYDLLTKQTYSRFIEYKNNGNPSPSLYGVSRYSFVCYGGPEFLTGTHTVTMYYKMIELCLVQRSSIVHFGSQVSQTTNEFELKSDFNKTKLKEKIDKLYRDYIRFINKFYIREITHQEQGIELYEMMMNTMNIPRQVKELDEEISELHQYANNLEQQSQTEQSAWLSKIATIFLPTSLMFGILGANFFENGNLRIDFNLPIDWMAILWVVLGFGFSIVIGFLSYNYFNSIQKKNNKLITRRQ